MVRIGSKMIHDIHSMTVSRYSKFDTTKQSRYLKRWFNFLPLFLFKKDIENLFKRLKVILNSEDEDDNLDEETYRQIMYAKILQLKNLYKGIYNIIITQNKNNSLKLKASLKVSNASNNLGFYIKRVKELTNIEVTDIPSLNKLFKFIEHKQDKYIENFDNAEKKKEAEADSTISFMKLALGIFSIMDINYSPKMSMYEFAELKTLAIERVQKQNSHGEHE